MPALDAATLVTALLDAIHESGAYGVLLSPLRQHPRVFVVNTQSGQFEVWVYVWTLTHGGRPNLPDEYRIQLTTVSSPLPLNPKGYTLLLGYEPNLGMFAGFDLSRHRTFAAGSPSVQIDLNCIHKALEDGLAFDRKTNREIAVGIRPDQLLNYMANAEDLHRMGKNAAMYNLLSRASASEAISGEEIASLGPKRRRVLSHVTRWARLGSFRQQVLRAYDHRCCVTRMQLRLVEAAHILPVHTGDTMNDFKRYLGRPIYLPADKRQRPDVSMIRKANRYRRIRH